MSEEHTTQQQPKWANLITVSEFKGVKKFYNFMPLLSDGEAFAQAMDDMMNLAEEKLGISLCCDESDDADVDLAVGIEARGFVIASAIANANGLGLVLARKPGSTPGDVVTTDEYDKEYGKDKLELQCNLIQKGDRIIIFDDLIATGGTAKALADLATKLGATVLAIVTMIELVELGGRKLLEDAGYKLCSALQY